MQFKILFLQFSFYLLLINLLINLKGLKLIVSNKGSKVRKNLLLSLIRDDKLELNDVKKLLSLIRDTFSPLNIARSAVQNIISPV